LLSMRNDSSALSPSTNNKPPFTKDQMDALIPSLFRREIQLRSVMKRSDSFWRLQLLQNLITHYRNIHGTDPTFAGIIFYIQDGMFFDLVLIEDFGITSAFNLTKSPTGRNFQVGQRVTVQFEFVIPHSLQSSVMVVDGDPTYRLF